MKTDCCPPACPHCGASKVERGWTSGFADYECGTEFQHGKTHDRMRACYERELSTLRSRLAESEEMADRGAAEITRLCRELANYKSPSLREIEMSARLERAEAGLMGAAESINLLTPSVIQVAEANNPELSGHMRHIGLAAEKAARETLVAEFES